MVYVMFVLVLFTACLWVKSPKNKYTYFFTLMTASLVGMMLVSITLWSYDYPSIWFFKLDYKLILKMHSFGLNYYGKQNVFNLAMIVYMSSLQLFRYDLKKHHTGFKKYFGIFIFLVFVVLYGWFYSADTAVRIYIKLNQIRNPHTFRQTVSALNMLFVAVQSIVILYPSAEMVISVHREEFWPKQKQKLTFGIYLFIISVFVLCFFVFGPLRNNYIDLSTETLLGIRNYFRISTYHYMILVVLLCVFVLCILYIVFRTKLFFAFASIRRNLYKSRWNIDGDTREIFHMFKNVLFNIEATARQGLLTEDSEEKNQKLDLITNLCEKKINDFFEITGMSKRADYTIKPVKIQRIFEEAFKRCHVGKDIKIEYEYLTTDDSIYVDRVSMTEAIANILKNAVESFDNIQREEKIITIRIRNDSDMVAIDILDNGKGMGKKELKNIHKPLYTTKSRRSNWGVGLSYVYKTVYAHCGHIRISSTKDKGTCVSIILYREAAYRFWKK